MYVLRQTEMWMFGTIGVLLVHAPRDVDMIVASHTVKGGQYILFVRLPRVTICICQYVRLQVLG